jgi:uncharacterized protein (DUF305 family)
MMKQMIPHHQNAVNMAKATLKLAQVSRCRLTLSKPE